MAKVVYLNDFVEEKKYLVSSVIRNLRERDFYCSGKDERIIFEDNLDFYPSKLKIFYPHKFSLVIGSYIIGKNMVNVADLLFDDSQIKSNFFHKWNLVIPEFNENISRLCGLLAQKADEHKVELGFYSKLDNSPLNLVGVLKLERK